VQFFGKTGFRAEDTAASGRPTHSRRRGSWAQSPGHTSVTMVCMDVPWRQCSTWIQESWGGSVGTFI
jgi:hypothetical protein